VTVQCPLAGIEPPVSVSVEAPLLPVTAPPQVVVPPPYTVMPAGRTSESAAVSAATVPLLLLRVMVSVETPPADMLAGLNDLLNDAGTTGMTVSVATAGEALLPVLVFSAPAASELK